MFVEKLTQEEVEQIFMGEYRKLISFTRVSKNDENYLLVYYEMQSRNCTYAKFYLTISDFEVKIKGDTGYYAKNEIDEIGTLMLREHFLKHYKDYESALNNYLGITTNNL